MPGDGAVIGRIQLVKRAATITMAETPKAKARRVPLGNLYVTRQLSEELEFQEIVGMIVRHSRMDWGDLDEEDRRANEDALESGARLISKYRAQNGIEVYVITEAEDENCERTMTTALLREEY